MPNLWHARWTGCLFSRKTLKDCHHHLDISGTKVCIFLPGREPWAAEILAERKSNVEGVEHMVATNTMRPLAGTKTHHSLYLHFLFAYTQVYTQMTNNAANHFTLSCVFMYVRWVNFTVYHLFALFKDSPKWAYQWRILYLLLICNYDLIWGHVMTLLLFFLKIWL